MTEHSLLFPETDFENFNAIKNGAKKIETRAGSEEYDKVKVGDVLKFVCGNLQFSKIVTQVEHFKSVEELMDSIPFQDFEPAAQTRDEAITIWQSYPGYQDRLKNYGIYAWTVKDL